LWFPADSSGISQTFAAAVLLASFAYARLRPEPLADLRAVPDGLR
jgi:hypothetical protein